MLDYATYANRAARLQRIKAPLTPAPPHPCMYVLSKCIISTAAASRVLDMRACLFETHRSASTLSS